MKNLADKFTKDHSEEIKCLQKALFFNSNYEKIKILSKLCQEKVR